jgi:hypothetical protein
VSDVTRRKGRTSWSDWRYAVDDDELAAELDGASAVLVEAALGLDLAAL